MDYSDRQVIVTGGTGALGSAVVGALIEAGATCYVPWRQQSEAQEFPYRQNEHVKLFGSIDLTDEAAVSKLFGEVPRLWASIHVAGGFAMAPVAKTGKNDLMHLIDMNLVSCFLCCSTAVNSISRSGQGGRIVNVAARHALEWRSGAGLVAYRQAREQSHFHRYERRQAPYHTIAVSRLNPCRRLLTPLVVPRPYHRTASAREWLSGWLEWPSV